MPELGEIGIDLSFEDLDFIEEGIENPEDIAAEGAAEENKNEGEGVAAEGSETEEQKAAKEAENNDESAEGAKGPDAVGGDSAEEDGKQTSPQLYQSLADTLIEKGVLTSVEQSSLKDIKSVDEFVDLMKEQIKNQELNDLTSSQKDILNGIREGASNSTVTKFRDAIEKLDNISDEMITDNIKVRQDLIYQDYLSKGFTPENASKQVDRSFKLKEDLADANESFISLKQVVKDRYESEKELEITTNKEDSVKAEKDKEALKVTMLKEKEVLKGYDIPENTRKEVYEEMMNHVSINPDTKEPENSLMKFQRENPSEFTHKLYYLWKLSNGFADLDYFGKKSSSSSVKNLEDAIKNSTHIQGGGDPSYSDDINTGLLDIDDIIIPE